MDVSRLLIAAVTVAALTTSTLRPAVAQSPANDTGQPPADLETRFKEGVQELGDGAQKIATAVEAGAEDLWAPGKAAFEAGAQIWQARPDARQQAAPAPPDRAPQR